MANLLLHPYCTSTISYVVNPGSINYVADRGDGDAYARVETILYNGRSAGELSLQNNGFEFITHPSTMQNWHDPEAVERIYKEEIGALVRKTVGCDNTVVFPAIIRSLKPDAEAGPLAFAHNDYTEKYLDMVSDPDSLYSKNFSGDSIKRSQVSHADIASARRVMLIQLWRNIGPSDPDFPLAVCNTRSVKRADLSELKTPGSADDFDYFALLPPKDPDNSYQWFTFPQMKADELILFCAYDSEAIARGEAFWTPHTSFPDPKGCSPRESIEMRVLCLFN